MTNWYCQHGVLIPGSCADCFRDRRDRFAAAALTGLLAENDQAFYDADTNQPAKTMDDSYRFAARYAVGYADALIAELDRQKEPT